MAIKVGINGFGRIGRLALRAAGKRVTYFDYPGVNHAFNNDTSAERYDKAAADLAWDRTLRFFRRNLG